MKSPNRREDAEVKEGYLPQGWGADTSEQLSSDCLSYANWKCLMKCSLSFGLNLHFIYLGGSQRGKTNNSQVISRKELPIHALSQALPPETFHTDCWGVQVVSFPISPHRKTFNLYTNLALKRVTLTTSSKSYVKSLLELSPEYFFSRCFPQTRYSVTGGKHH